MIFRKKLKTIRVRLDMSQRELALFSGISLPTIQRFEIGVKPGSKIFVYLIEWLYVETESTEFQKLCQKAETVKDVWYW